MGPNLCLQWGFCPYFQSQFCTGSRLNLKQVTILNKIRASQEIHTRAFARGPLAWWAVGASRARAWLWGWFFFFHGWQRAELMILVWGQILGAGNDAGTGDRSWTGDRSLTVRGSGDLPLTPQPLRAHPMSPEGHLLAIYACI